MAIVLASTSTWHLVVLLFVKSATLMRFSFCWHSATFLFYVPDLLSAYNDAGFVVCFSTLLDNFMWRFLVLIFYSLRPIFSVHFVPFFMSYFCFWAGRSDSKTN